MVQALHIKNAFVWDAHNRAEQHDLYTSADGRFRDEPAHDSIVVDLDGYALFPGLINAHDHLELNHYPRSKFRDRYDNAHQWGEDMNARLDSEPYKSLRAYPIWDRLFIGGLKNLLCGATTVVHHNPPHKELWRKNFPVRVLKQYGWAHSLHFSTDEEIVRSYRSTPPDVPWFIHLAEGTDDVAAGEYRQLKALGCIGNNTVIVHGVGMTEADIADAAPRVRGLVRCPTTNLYLLETSWCENHWWDWNIGRLALGSDSRLTSNRDLLNEMRTAEAEYRWPPSQVVEMATYTAAAMVGLDSVGNLRTRTTASLIAIKGDADDDEEQLCSHLCYAHRADLALVVKDGVPQIGDPEVMAKFPHVQTIPAVLDGKLKAIHRDLAQSIHRCKLKEPGLDVDELPKGSVWLWRKA